MLEGILESIKKMLGLDPMYEAFDTDIIIHINSVFMALNQLGVGPKEGFSISGYMENWSDFTDKKNLEAIKTYIYLKVRLLFDPPSNSFTIAAFEEQIKEYEWRIVTQVERRDLDEGIHRRTDSEG